MGDDEGDVTGSQAKRLRLEGDDPRRFYDPSLADPVVAFEEADRRDEKNALVVRECRMACIVASTQNVYRIGFAFVYYAEHQKCGSDSRVQYTQVE